MTAEDPVVVGECLSDHVVCPDCDGSTTCVLSGIRYAEGHSGPPVREVNCWTCEGLGSITKEHLQRIERGHAFREYRTSVLGLGLRKAADLWGMKASELSYIEQGKVVTDWIPPGFK